MAFGIVGYIVLFGAPAVAVIAMGSRNRAARLAPCGFLSPRPNGESAPERACPRETGTVGSSTIPTATSDTRERYRNSRPESLVWLSAESSMTLHKGIGQRVGRRSGHPAVQRLTRPPPSHCATPRGPLTPTAAGRPATVGTLNSRFAGHAPECIRRQGRPMPATSPSRLAQSAGFVEKGNSRPALRPASPASVSGTHRKPPGSSSIARGRSHRCLVEDALKRFEILVGGEHPLGTEDADRAVTLGDCLVEYLRGPRQPA